MKQRAHNEEDKQRRRQAIVEAALELGAGTAYAEVTMADIAVRAGLAKGTVFLYFPTKEALYLALLTDELARWFDGVDARLDEGGRWSSGRVTRVITQSLAERSMLAPLLALLESTLERNIDYETALRFKRWLLDRTLATGARLERRLPWLVAALEAGAGARLILHTRALLTGLWQMASNSPVVAQVLALPDMTVFRVSFSREFEAAFSALLRGDENTATAATDPGAPNRRRQS